MTLSLPLKGDTPRALSYRAATHEDLPFLRQLRIECGWGLARLEQRFGSPNWPHIIFTLIEGDAPPQDVGMAAWVLENYEDPEAASRATNTVYLCKTPPIVEDVCWADELAQPPCLFASSFRAEEWAPEQWIYSSK